MTDQPAMPDAMNADSIKQSIRGRLDEYPNKIQIGVAPTGEEFHRVTSMAFSEDDAWQLLAMQIHQLAQDGYGTIYWRCDPNVEARWLMGRRIWAGRARLLISDRPVGCIPRSCACRDGECGYGVTPDGMCPNRIGRARAA